jgi:hypothetical protein
MIAEVISMIYKESIVETRRRRRHPETIKFKQRNKRQRYFVLYLFTVFVLQHVYRLKNSTTLL